MAQYQTIPRAGTSRTAMIDEGLRAHMNKVYGIMSVGMLITAAAAWAISGLALSDAPTQYQIGQNTYLTEFGATLWTSPLKWVIMFAPLAMVFAFGAMINKLSAAGAQTFFYAFAALMGLSLSWIFAVYTGVSIIQVFFITAIAFASLSLWGYTTKKDISGWGSFLIMGVVGLIVASIVNIFLGSGTVQLAISVLGVLIFAGLTAYDTQKIKTDYIAHAQHGDSEWLAKSAIMGALNLYLDFINMFMFLLQLFGNRE
ncbi:Bax inhibitor-1/YccA family protein [Salipiger sp. IMCC34102]|uniref:Bax inhibitor-1/YccA family protein n=1 Tax=Salipiger sp. IMCC34102 TaxID=2510647 RepID=UPI00101B86AA|nr:Bax inhibitor-1/YccA family protein [Salipiger sp. IMCC34102]RYH01856.1 Bax inhibitor-1/YccA family protein [Salipiger sp. IMCC34102]